MKDNFGLLETLAVQLFRDNGLPTPTRQVTVINRHGTFVARVDLAWPELGVFVELDGQGHAGQPVYDASRTYRAKSRLASVRPSCFPVGRRSMNALERLSICPGVMCNISRRSSRGCGSSATASCSTANTTRVCTGSVRSPSGCSLGLSELVLEDLVGLEAFDLQIVLGGGVERR